MSKISFTNDFDQLCSLPKEKLDEIRAILAQERPDASIIKSKIPESFLRLLVAYDAVRESIDSHELSEQARTLHSWFQEKFADVANLPGFASVLSAGKRGLQVKLTANEEKITESLGLINSIRCLYGYSGTELLPTIRFFFFNENSLLLDATGDWDDWSFVARRLLEEMAAQADETRSIRHAWREVNFAKIRKHLDGVKESLELFRKVLDEMSEQVEILAQTDASTPES